MRYQRYDVRFSFAIDISKEEWEKKIKEPYIKPLYRGEGYGYSEDTYCDMRNDPPVIFYWKKGEKNG